MNLQGSVSAYKVACWLSHFQVEPVTQCWLQPKDAPKVAIDRLCSRRNSFYVNTIGEVPKGMEAMPTCGNNRCVNPLHCELKPIVRGRPERRAAFYTLGTID